MRFYVKDSKRKPDPEPVKVNARLAIAVGLAIWAITLVLLVVGFAPETAALKPATAIVGLALGLFGWFWVGRRR